MATAQLFRSRKPIPAILGFTAAGVSLYIARSYITNNAFAESREPSPALSNTFGTSLRLASSETVNHNTKRLKFEFPDSESKSGLVLTSSVLVITWPKGKFFPTPRPYTPVSSFNQKGSLELLVKQYPNGKASTYLHSLSPGDTLYFATALKGYQWKPNQYPSITLIAGGAGITPCYQLINGILQNPEDKTKITLVFGVNSDADVLLRKEFKDFEEQFPGRFKAVYTVSRPGENSEFRKGYVTKELLEDVMPTKKEGKVFVCGPPAMEKALLGGGGPFGKGEKGILEQLGYGKGEVHKF